MVVSTTIVHSEINSPFSLIKVSQKALIISRLALGRESRGRFEMTTMYLLYREESRPTTLLLIAYYRTQSE
jgi:hypothetical protein